MKKHQKELAEKIIHLHKENINQPGFFTWNPMPRLFCSQRQMNSTKKLLKDNLDLIKDYTDQTTILTEKGSNFKDFATTRNRKIKINVYSIVAVSYLLGILTPDIIKQLKRNLFPHSE